MRKTFLYVACMLLGGMPLFADSLDNVRENPCITASNHYIYPDKDLPELTYNPQNEMLGR